MFYQECSLDVSEACGPVMVVVTFEQGPLDIGHTRATSKGTEQVWYK